MKPEDLSEESIKPPATLHNNLNPRLDNFNSPKFREECDIFVYYLWNKNIAILFSQWFYIKKLFISGY